jgi:hypothetical protein
MPPVASEQAQLLGQKSQKPPPGPQDGKGREGEDGKESLQQPPDPQKGKGREGEDGKESLQKKDGQQQPGGKRSGTDSGVASNAPFAVPEMQISIPALPSRGQLAVQAPADIAAKYAEGSGAVVLILDCSGSMDAPADPTKPMGARPTRFDEARRALLEVLRSIPRGTQVSLWAFSHAVNLDTGKLMRNDDSEDTIQRVFFRMNWEATEEAMNQVRARVEALVPYNDTPIVRSMMSAIKDFKDRPGFKNLVILTDGMDNRFEKQPGGKWRGDPVLNPSGNLTIPAFIEKTFGQTAYKDIAIRVIGFQLPPEEEAASRRQFKEPLERLPTKGRFYLVGDTVALIAKLKDSIEQRLFFTVEESSGQPVKDLKGGVAISRQGTDSHWVDLKPGHYWVVVDARKKLRQKVEIGRGDRLRLNLHEQGDGFVLKRELVESAFPGRVLPRVESQGWRVSVLQNQKRDADRPWLQMTFTVEALRQREFRGEMLGHVTPSLVLFQVRPRDDRKGQTSSLRSYALSNYTARAWGVDVKPWDQAQQPVLEAFWDQGPLDRHTAGVLRRGQHFSEDLQVLPESNSLEVQLSKGERGSVRLLSLKVEKHWADTWDGKRQEFSCLVVQMSFPRGRPVLAQLPNFSGGQEHRVSTEAGKYTGLFWEMTPQQAQQAVESLNLISLTGFREAALAAGQHVRIELGVPDNDPRPNPRP